MTGWLALVPLFALLLVLSSTRLRTPEVEEPSEGIHRERSLNNGWLWFLLLLLALIVLFLSFNVNYAYFFQTGNVVART